MSSDSFTIKQGDRLPSLVRTFKNSDGSSIDLSTALSVTFRMRLVGTTVLKVESAASIVDALTGVVSYSWQIADTDTGGTYESEFEVAFSGAGALTVPNDGYMLVHVVEELG